MDCLENSGYSLAEFSSINLNGTQVVFNIENKELFRQILRENFIMRKVCTEVLPKDPIFSDEVGNTFVLWSSKSTGLCLMELITHLTI